MTNDVLEIAEHRILAPAGLDEGHLGKVLGAIMGRAVDSADLYFQTSRTEAWSLEDGIVREGSHSIEQGVGVRAMSGEKTGFAYSDELELPALPRAGSAARWILDRLDLSTLTEMEREVLPRIVAKLGRSLLGRGGASLSDFVGSPRLLGAGGLCRGCDDVRVDARARCGRAGAGL